MLLSMPLLDIKLLTCVLYRRTTIYFKKKAELIIIAGVSGYVKSLIVR